MSLEVRRYTSNDNILWDEFINNSLNGNFLHKRSFYDSNPANAIDDYSLLFFKKNKIVAAFPAVLSNEDGNIILNSHQRSTYGGVIINTEIGIIEALEIIKLIIENAHANKVFLIKIRNPFRIFYDRISDEIDYALWFHNFIIDDRQAEIYIDLSPEKSVIKNRYDNGNRYNVKKAWKHILVSVSEHLKEFWLILEKNLIEKHNQKPVHSFDEILKLKALIGESNIILFCAYKDNVLVAGCLVFKIKNALHAQYIAQDSLYQEFRPISAVLDYIIDWGKDNGFKYFNLGTANEGGKNINEGLFHFKESFGGRAVLRETMVLNLKKYNE